MKYLKIFETVSEMEEYKPTDEMISYVNEHDKCHVQEMYKVCSYTLHLESPQDYIVLIPSFNFDFKNIDVDKVTINGIPINTDTLIGVATYGTSIHNFGYIKYNKSFNGFPVYSFPTKCEIGDIDEETGYLNKIFSDYVDVWFDMQKSQVTSISDNTQVMFTLIKADETYIQPLQVYESSGTGVFTPYIWCGERGTDSFFDEFYMADEEYEGDYHLKSELVPFESGDYSVVLYSAKKDIEYCFGMGLKSAEYQNYTLGKYVTTLKSQAFAKYNDFTEIWYY